MQRNAFNLYRKIASQIPPFALQSLEKMYGQVNKEPIPFDTAIQMIQDAQAASSSFLEKTQDLTAKEAFAELERYFRERGWVQQYLLDRIERIPGASQENYTPMPGNSYQDLVYNIKRMQEQSTMWKKLMSKGDNPYAESVYRILQQKIEQLFVALEERRKNEGKGLPVQNIPVQWHDDKNWQVIQARKHFRNWYTKLG